MDTVVMRSLALPKELDEALKAIAFHEGSSLHEVRERFIRQGVESYREQLRQWQMMPKKD